MPYIYLIIYDYVITTLDQRLGCAAPKCLLKYKNTLNNFIKLETKFYWKLIEHLVFINATDHNTMVTSIQDRKPSWDRP